MISNENARSAFIQDREKDISAQVAKYESLHRTVSNVRLLFFVLSIGSIIFNFAVYASIWLIILSVVCFWFFIIAVTYHFQISKTHKYYIALKDVHQEYVARTTHRFEKLKDDGADFVDRSHDYSADLDLFGPASIFHFLNVAQTYFGRRALRDFLLSAQDEALRPEHIDQRQAAVAEFASDPAQAQHFQAKGRLISQIKKSPKAFLDYASFYERPDKPLPVWRIVLCMMLTVILILSVVISLILNINLYSIALLVILVQLIIVAATHQKFKLSFAAISGIQPELYAYKSLFELIEKSTPKAPILKEIKRDIYGEDDAPHRVSDQLKAIHRICLFIQVRSQPLLFLMLNTLFLYDHYCHFFLDRWVDRSGKDLPKYLNALGQWEALMSLSTLNFVYPEASFPQILRANTTDEGRFVSFNAQKMGHPLIPVDKQVRNDFDLNKGIALITGSNMSGKTTLLRTVGVNTVLAYAGAVCCAQSMSLGLMYVVTSMRIADSLEEGLSTFYAELMRIERIVRKSRDKKPLLFLIDEIFRGTNSKDRTDGAQIIIDQLSKDWVIGLMSTHDYQLCDINKNRTDRFVFYYFSERYDEDGIHFDYVLSKGISKSANARYLMKLVGIE